MEAATPYTFTFKLQLKNGLTCDLEALKIEPKFPKQNFDIKSIQRVSICFKFNWENLQQKDTTATVFKDIANNKRQKQRQKMRLFNQNSIQSWAKTHKNQRLQYMYALCTISNSFK